MFHVCNLKYKLLLRLIGYSGCTGPSLLHTGFLQLWGAGATLRRGAQAAQAGLLLEARGFQGRAGLRSCSTWAPQLQIEGSRAQAQ